MDFALDLVHLQEALIQVKLFWAVGLDYRDSPTLMDASGENNRFVGEVDHATEHRQVDDLRRNNARRRLGH